MTPKRTTKITIETDRVLVIRRPKRQIRAWCAECGEQVPMATPQEAAVVAGVTSRTIYRWVGSAKVHFTETSDGLLLVCPNSLPVRPAEGASQ